MSTAMTLRPRVMDPRKRDDISEVLHAATRPQHGETPVPVYVLNWYPDGLRDVTLGAHSRKLVGVTRYYPTLDPKVVVDFEPAPPDKWFFEEKLKFFTERGIVYLGIALRDQLTDEQFVTRYKDARHLLDRSKSATHEALVLRDAAFVEGALAEPELALALDRAAVAMASAECGRDGRPLVGKARLNRIATRKRELVARFRERLKHGTLDPVDCRRELENETQRRADGQVHSPEPSRSHA